MCVCVYVCGGCVCACVKGVCVCARTRMCVCVCGGWCACVWEGGGECYQGRIREEGMQQLASKNQSGRWNLLAVISKNRYLLIDCCT